jgi:hypothetical protein
MQDSKSRLCHEGNGKEMGIWHSGLYDKLK